MKSTNGPYSEWSERQKQSQRERTKRWRQNNPEKFRASSLLSNERRRIKYATEPEYREKVLSNKIWKERNREQARQKRLETKKAVYDHYGRECKCCGEMIELFLTIDHINTDGAAHRRSIDKKGNGRNIGSAATYTWLIKHNFPEGFQTLCQNCNSGRYRNGGICPHKAPPGQS